VIIGSPSHLVTRWKVLDETANVVVNPLDDGIGRPWHYRAASPPHSFMASNLSKGIGQYHRPIDLAVGV
jgi:hypothetical protein